MFILKRNTYSIMAAISSKDISQQMVRVKSSNVWAYAMNVPDKKNTTGTLYVQFKGTHGGPRDIYAYYDVPVVLYRRWQSAPSKGAFFWRYIRNYYLYSKLTGDKRGKLKNAVNH